MLISEKILNKMHTYLKDKLILTSFAPLHSYHIRQYHSLESCALPQYDLELQCF